MGKNLTLVFVLLFIGCTVVGVALWQGLTSFVFAWVLNFMLMVGVLYLTQTFKPRLASTYYHSKKWEAEGKIYKWLGVHGFRKVLLWVGWEKLHKASNPVKKSLAALKHLEYGTRQSEFGLLLFFEKGTPTKDIWYFEHPYPEGVKSYNKGKPIHIKEFDLEKAWWNNREDEQYSRYAWKVSAEEIKARGYNLDIKNPHQEADDLASPEVILKKYRKTEKEISRI